MTAQKLKKYRGALEELARQTGATARSLEDAARTSTGGESSGNISNTPMHLGDIGSEVYNQELNATLLETEEQMQQDVNDALERLDGGDFGVCEDCGQRIPDARLDVVPYARFCVPCAERAEAGGTLANLNDGRPAGWGSTFDDPAALAGRKRSGESSPFNAPRSNTTAAEDDTHAAGTPGGGSAIGGLAGTNINDGEPDDTLEDAMGSGNFDTAADADEAAEGDAYSGRTGGAVGGTPANKRAHGGQAPRDRGAAGAKKQ